MAFDVVLVAIGRLVEPLAWQTGRTACDPVDRRVSGNGADAAAEHDQPDIEPSGRGEHRGRVECCFAWQYGKYCVTEHEEHDEDVGNGTVRLTIDEPLRLVPKKQNQHDRHRADGRPTQHSRDIEMARRRLLRTALRNLGGVRIRPRHSASPTRASVSVRTTCPCPTASKSSSRSSSTRALLGTPTSQSS